jgi:uncharacterized membrane protein (DUF2068 family)
MLAIGRNGYFMFQGVRIDYAEALALAYAIGVFALVQGYGFWKLTTWSWWLFLVYEAIHLISIPILPQSSFDVRSPTGFGSVAGQVAGVLLLIYLIKRRNLFNI